MRMKDIQVGKTYVNRGDGRTKREVLVIGDEYRPNRFLSDNEPLDESGVMYLQDGKEYNLYLSSFASWAGRAILLN